MTAKVNIIVVTYKHAQVIARCLNSLLAQKTNFPFTIIVAVDGSPDDTAAVVRRYAEQHPALIQAFIHDTNVGPGPNFTKALDAVTAPYVAYCDGDDYWCDENKLQIAVDTLDQHPECTVFVHDTEVHNNVDKTVVRVAKPVWKKLLINHKFSLLTNQYTHISARVWRNTDFPNKGDSFMYHYLLSRGYGYYYDKVMSVYNYDRKGAWSGLTNKEQKLRNYQTLYDLNKALDFKYDFYYTLKMPKSLFLYKILHGKKAGWQRFLEKQVA